MPRPLPLATYRIQFTPDFGFDDAAAIVPYLRDLGITHLYASPFLKARAGSTHGYNVVDFNQLNPELGGPDGFARLSAALGQADMGLILDFVPNHMAVNEADNAWWLDMLEWQASPYAAFFDVDWEAPSGRVLLPILGSPYGRALEKNEIELRYDAGEGSFSAWYFEHRLPIRPQDYGRLLQTLVSSAEAAETDAGRNLLGIVERFHGPDVPNRDEAPQLKAALAAMSDAARIIASGLDAFRAGRDESGVTNLHHLLERQNFRPAYWRLAANEINYRRFFDITDLAGLRIEDPRVFEAAHDLTGRLIGEGALQGLRIDHIDGLRDPAEYCRRLQDLVAMKAGAGAPFYVVVEKILGDDEPMPPLAGVAGSTGYETIGFLTRVLVDPAGLPALERLAEEMTGQATDFAATLEQTKGVVLERLFAGEFDRLVQLLARIAAGHWQSRDYTATRLGEAFRLYVLRFPVYRTYVTDEGASAADRAMIGRTIAAARASWEGTDESIFDFLADLLTLDLVAPERRGYSLTRARRFVARLQQFTGPLMAKALEDTALYRDLRLLALNEVGGDPSLPPLSLDEFHRLMQARTAATPHALSATTTHDTKRSEDARARLMALSELGKEWATAVRRWRRLTAPVRTTSGTAPSAAHEYLFYQTLLGSWPNDGPDDDFIARIEAYLVKAAREGKQETSWLHPDEGYEAVLTGFARRALSAPAFVHAVTPLAQKVALIGCLNGLAQLVLKATAPGIPDFYQGSELWDLSLVDPDNRRPVDFALRHDLLRSAQAPDWRALAADWPSGRIKLALTNRLLSLRAESPDLFLNGDYRPIEARGAVHDRVIAFARTHAGEAIIVAAGRHFAGPTEGGRRWPRPSAWNAALVLDGYTITADLLEPKRPLPKAEAPLAALFATLPVALLRATMRQ